MKTRIVTDSSSDILTLPKVEFASAPLKIITAEKEYIDDERLNVRQMVDELSEYNGKSSTSCPNPADWLNAFGDAEQIFCITITGTLSGAYNAACAAKNSYEEMYPERKVFVLNSLSTGPEMRLIVDKLQELIGEKKDFYVICDTITQYSKKTGLMFMLESMKNLANNGRVHSIVAKTAGLLGIRVVGKASDKGDLEPLNKCRGEKNALKTIVQQMKNLGYSGGKVRIAHCFNDDAGEALKELIKKEFSKAQIKISKCRGLCSFYAEKGGLLVGFEKA